MSRSDRATDATGPAGPASGKVLWSYTYEPGKDEKWNAEPTAIAVGRGGSIYMTGFIETTTNDVDFLTIKLRPNGELEWARRYNGRGNDVDRARSLVLDDAGNCYVLGDAAMGGGNESTRLSGLDLVVLKYDADGNELWRCRLDGGFDGEDRAVKIRLDPRGAVLVGGTSWGPPPPKGTQWDWLFVKLTPDSGRIVWKRRFDGAARMDDTLRDFCIGPQGEAYGTGSGTRPHRDIVTDDALTMSITTAGHLGWRRRHENGLPGQNTGTRVYLDPTTGRLYITAQLATGDLVSGRGWLRPALISAHADGWTRVDESAPVDGTALDVAAAPDGKIWMVGQSYSDFCSWLFTPDGGNPRKITEYGMVRAGSPARRVLSRPDGSMVVAGSLVNGPHEQGGTDVDVAVFRYAPDGAVLSRTVHYANLGDTLADAALCPDGSVAAVSHTFVAPGKLTYCLVKILP